RRIIIIALAIIIVIGGSLFMIDLIKANKHFEKPLSSCSYYSGGGMTGGYASRIVKASDGKAIIEISNASWHCSLPISFEYEADSIILKEIEDIFYDYRMSNYDGLKNSPFFAADAPTSSYSFIFGDEKVSFASNQIIPAKGSEALGKILDLIDDYCKSHQPLPSLDLSELSSEDIEKGTLVNEGERDLKIYDYRNRTLSYYINNGLSDYEFNDAYRLYYEGMLLVSSDHGDKMVSYANTSEVYEIRLSDYLKAGSYRLEIADMEVGFEIK
ncbi:MAG: hypothetical protein PUD22_06770, partial [Erysipelotrichaceae bacterium]|nr:hypothetical protein [Erysipelotrichaceae bacterium]